MFVICYPVSTAKCHMEAERIARQGIARVEDLRTYWIDEQRDFKPEKGKLKVLAANISTGEVERLI